MSESAAFDQIVRALPIAKPPAPTHHEPWPDHALLVTFRTERPGGGALTFGAATLIGGTQQPVWAIAGRGVLASEARRFFGRRSGVPVLGLEEFFEEAIQRCVYKPPLRAGLVAWSVPSFVSSGAWTVDPRGDAFRFTWWTYVDEHDDRRPNMYRCRVRVRPSSGGRATVGLDSRKSPDPEDWVVGPNGRRHQYRGRFLSLSTLGYVATGDDQLTLPQALAAWGIEPPREYAADGLFSELEALGKLYEAMLGDLSCWPGAIPDAGASPAYLARRIAQLAVPRPPADRPGISLRAKAIAQAAHVGGKSQTYVRGIEVPGVLVDATAAFPIAAHLVGSDRWLQAERIEQRHLTPGRGLASLVRELESFSIEQLLAEPESWAPLAGVGLVDPHDDLLAVRGRLLGKSDDHTSTLPIAAKSDPVPCGLPRVVASYLCRKRMPRLLEAYTFRPVGIVGDARAVNLPGGIVFDPTLDRPRRGHRFRELPMALAEIGLRAKAGTLQGIDRAQMARIAGAVKTARNVTAYGGPVEINPSARTHGAWGPGGKLTRGVHEEPGWLFDPVAGSLVVAACELLLTLLELLVEEGARA